MNGNSNKSTHVREILINKFSISPMGVLICIGAKEQKIINYTQWELMRGFGTYLILAKVSKSDDAGDGQEEAKHNDCSDFGARFHFLDFINTTGQQ